MSIGDATGNVWHKFCEAVYYSDILKAFVAIHIGGGLIAGCVFLAKALAPVFGCFVDNCDATVGNVIYVLACVVETAFVAIGGTVFALDAIEKEGRR